MIVEKTHHRHTGTHDAASLLDWIAAASWRPLPLEEFANALARGSERFESFIPRPHWHWVKGRERVANSSARYGHAEWEVAGWEAAALYDLDEVGARIAEVIGLRCRACDGVYEVSMLTTRSVGYGRDSAICAHCHRAAAPVLQGRSRLHVAANVMALPLQLRDARKALSHIRERLPPSNAKALAYSLGLIEAALGSESP